MAKRTVMNPLAYLVPLLLALLAGCGSGDDSSAEGAGPGIAPGAGDDAQTDSASGVATTPDSQSDLASAMTSPDAGGAPGSAGNDSADPATADSPSTADAGTADEAPTADAGADDAGRSMVLTSLGPCCETHDTPGCQDEVTTECVCDRIPECCTGTWGDACVIMVTQKHCEPGVRDCVCGSEEGQWQLQDTCCMGNWSELCRSTAVQKCGARETCF